MQIFLEPMDVWVFRDGRPFSAGEDHHAKCVFPPSAFTVQGALRSKVLTERCGNLDRYAGREDGPCDVCGPAPECPLRAEIGSRDHAGPFRLGWVLPAQRMNGSTVPFVPLPRHVVSGKESRRWHYLRPAFASGTGSLPGALTALGVLAPEPVEHPGGWIDASTLGRLLGAESVDSSPLGATLCVVRTQGERSAGDMGEGSPGTNDEKETAILVEEPRVGIGLAPGRRTAQAGRFSVVDALRLHEGWGLAVSFEGLPSLPPRGFLDIGGEGRAARYDTISEAGWPAPPAAEIERERRFLLYLLSPALFQDEATAWGWKPGFLGEDLTAVLPGSATRVRLVAAAVGPPLRISGWELGKGARGGHPRPARAAVPAGSVYFFEVVDGPVAPALELHGRAMAGWGEELGFGTALVGRWP